MAICRGERGEEKGKKGTGRKMTGSRGEMEME